MPTDIDVASAVRIDLAHRPSDGIRRLVCSFASPIRQRRLLVVLQAYIDDSGSEPTGRVFVLAGFVATAESWERFSDEWAAACDREPKTPDFHMALAHRLKGGYWGRGSDDQLRNRRDGRLQELASIIRKHALLRIATGVTWRAYEAAARGKVPPEIDYPYFFLFWRIIQAVVRWQAQTGRREKVDFIFDEQGKIGWEAAGWRYRYLDVMNEDERFILSGTPIFRSDTDVLPLKAADMGAWYYRREVVERDAHLRRDESYERPEPINVLWELPYMVMNLTEDGLRQMIEAANRGNVGL